MEENHEGGISRRKILKRMGAGMAVAWSAPVLTSLASPAYAQTPSDCPPADCSNLEFCGPEASCGIPPGCEGFAICTAHVPDGCLCTSGAGECLDCQSDADCEAVLPGTRCAQLGDLCGCPGTGQRACMFPCGSSRPRGGKQVIKAG
jgi:hypothetical protein